MADKPTHWLGKLKADSCLRYTAVFFLLAVDILAIAAIIIGVTYQGQCPINQNIATFLIVGGIVFMIYFTFLLLIVSNSFEQNLIKICSESSSCLLSFDCLLLLLHKYPKENDMHFHLVFVLCVYS